MPITLTPEQEELVIVDARNAGFESPEAYLADRLNSLHFEDQYITEHRDEFAKLIDEGIDSMEREDSYTVEEVKAHLEVAKQEFHAAKRSAA